MTTLSKRATSRQAMALRMVAGAVINAGHAHPEWKIEARMARSIAKRAVGTLTAAWPEVLAASAPSERGGKHARHAASRSRRDSGTAAPMPGASSGTPGMGERSRPRGRSPASILRGQLGALAADARRHGQTERLAVLVEVLQIMARRGL